MERSQEPRAGIVVQRLEERCIDREARHHTRMLNLHFDPSHFVWQPTHGVGGAVRPQRVPDFGPMRQALSINPNMLWR
jgi:hypothetical protein